MMRTAKKVGIGLGIIVGGLLMYMGYHFIKDKADGEIHLIPKGYEGVVIIIFDQKDGKPEKYENGSRIYEVPKNGILKTQFTTNYGWYPTLKYYYMDGNNRSEIARVDFPKDISKEITQVIGGARGNTIFPPEKVSYSYLSYLVCKYKDVDSLSKVSDSLEKANLIFPKK